MLHCFDVIPTCFPHRKSSAAPQSKPVAAATITQRVRVVQQADKKAALEDYLRGVLEQQRGQGGADGAAGAPRAMVFCSTKSACDMLAYNINTWVAGCGGAPENEKVQGKRAMALGLDWGTGPCTQRGLLSRCRKR